MLRLFPAMVVAKTKQHILVKLRFEVEERVGEIVYF